MWLFLKIKGYWFRFMNSNKRDLVILLLIIGFVIIFPVLTKKMGNNSALNDGNFSENSSGDDGQNKDDCNTIGINLHGMLVTYPAQYSQNNSTDNDFTASENIMSIIQKAEDNDKIKAILLDVDSFGGVAVAGEEVSSALKKATKPTVAYIRNGGASAAYMAATGAKTIFASRFSNIGGIGVTSSYLDSVEKNKKDGLTFNQLSVGKYKDMGNEDKPLTDEEKELVMRDLNIMQADFIKLVSENRGIDIEQVTAIADGSTILGQSALDNKLIDHVGNYFDVLDFVSSTIGEKPTMCWY